MGKKVIEVIANEFGDLRLEIVDFSASPNAADENVRD